MIGFIETAGDKLLSIFVPKVVAKADTTFETICYCLPNGFYMRKVCHVVGGHTACGKCYISSPCR